MTWVGIRLGATLAVRAAAGIGTELQGLILVDPIVDGPAYSRSLRRQHVERLEQVFRRPERKWRAALDSNPDAFTDEASGFGLAPEFHAQLAQISASQLPLPQTLRSTVVFGAEDPAISAWRVKVGETAQVDWVPLDHGYDWTAHEATDGTLLPAKILRDLLQRLEA